MKTRDRLIVAIDRSSRGEILSLADSLHGIAGLYKIGLQAFLANGSAIVHELAGRGESVFLDLKLHDIPNTVQQAVTEIMAMKVSMLTLHTAGGSAMMRAAAREVASKGPILLGVTVLTSLSEADLEEVGFSGTTESRVTRLARLAQQAGLRGVVASPIEIEAIREACGPQLLIVTPGIRGRRDATGDQKRTMTARAALEAGADYIVVGRPITEARDPRGAALALLENAQRARR
ncbi:MAG TPA: orotidine-5'-phosphate decarboxylase [Thermoanaerobaculia bacterium]|nr:orotidine-5'-phosphate decarboxylase [Thermoanaerobaculia bacterium]